MRKALMIVLGIALFAGAAGVLYWRIETGQWLTSVGIEEPAAEIAAAPEGANRTLRESARPRAQAPAGGSRLAMVFDALNIVVGVVGIWCTIVGIRMQRQSMGQRS